MAGQLSELLSKTDSNGITLLAKPQSDYPSLIPCTIRTLQIRSLELTHPSSCVVEESSKSQNNFRT